MMKVFRVFIVLFLLFTFNEQSLAALNSQKLFSFVPEEAKDKQNLGVLIKSIKTGKTIFSYNSKKNFIPASNNKIISSFTALSLLGKDFRFKTEFYSGGEIRNGVLYGGLYIKGFGDPTIKPRQLEAIADRLKSMGVSKIKGGIYLDDSYYDQHSYAEGWKNKWVGLHYCPPVSPFILNYNNIDIHITPGKIGQPANFKLFPENTAFEIDNKTTTTKKTSTLKAYFSNDGNKFLLRGSVSSRRGEEIVTVSVLKPLVFFGSAMRNILVKKGIEVEGSLYRDNIPKWANYIFTDYSSPLEEIVQEYNKESVNIIGESLMKTLGAVYVTEPGTWKDGASVIKDYLHDLGIKQDINVVDGSGLSNLNKVSPDTLSQILSFAYQDSKISKVFTNSLPVAGIDGTLKKRFLGTKIKGRVFAKTGYLSGVRSLSGYAFSDDGDVFVFSIISNGLGWKAKKFQEDVLAELVSCCG